MKFAIFSLVPLLAAANAIGEREVKTMESELKVIDLKDLPKDSQMSNAGPFKGDLKTAVYPCPSNFPNYCPRYAWCCPSYSPSCCPRSCCLPGTRYCGTDGNCYR